MTASSKNLLATLSVGFGLAALACTAGPKTSERTARLGDADGDGVFASEACASAGGADDCIIYPYPGDPTGCAWVDYSETERASGDGTVATICVQCIGPDGTPVGDPICSDPIPPIVCEVLPPYSGGGSEPGAPAPADASDVATGVIWPTCWVCILDDGTIIEECVEPPPTGCWSDGDCAAGQHCEIRDEPTPPPCDPAAGDTCVSFVPYPVDPPGICVDDTIWCSSDADCPAGFRCEYAPPPPCDPSLGPCVAGIAIAGQCVPAEPRWCASDDDCAPGEYCAFDGGPAPCTDPSEPCPLLWAAGVCRPRECAPVLCDLYCEYGFARGADGCEICACNPPPPVDPCSVYTDEASCVSSDCDWYALGVPCADGETCVSGVCQSHFPCGGDGGGAPGASGGSR